MKETDQKKTENVTFSYKAKNPFALSQDREVTINTEEFEKVEPSKFRAKEDKRYNLKLYETDVELLDYLSAEIGTSRNNLVGLILEQVLRGLLDGVKTEDTQLLIAESADEMVDIYWRHINSPWTAKYFWEKNEIARKNIRDHGSPEAICRLPAEEIEFENLKLSLAEAKQAGDNESEERILQELRSYSGHTNEYWAVAHILDGEKNE